MFPSCWDGQSFEIKDQKEHVAYPSEVMTGTCPSGFPIRLPSLFYETIWNTYEFVGQAGQFILANGDPTGMSFPLPLLILLTPSRLRLPRRLHDGLGPGIPPGCSEHVHQPLRPDRRLPALQYPR
jgi:hypothetical protein